jgi:hypothetical protein
MTGHIDESVDYGRVIVYRKSPLALASARASFSSSFISEGAALVVLYPFQASAGGKFLTFKALHKLSNIRQIGLR